MARKHVGIVVGGWLFTWVAASAQPPGSSPALLAPQTAGGSGIVQAQKEDPAGKKADKDKKEEKAQPPQVDLATAPPTSAESATGFRPQMLGDYQGLAKLVTVQVPSLAKVVVPVRNENGKPTFVTFNVPVTGQRTVRVPVGGRGGFKIGENETIMPNDRAFVAYNYYNNVQGPSQGSDQAIVVNQDVDFRNQTFASEVFVPGVAVPRLDLNRQTVGFEKSFLDGAISFGVRVPLFQLNGASPYADQNLGDLTFVGKYAVVNDPATGVGVTAGLAITVPTGPDFIASNGDNIHATIIQPFLGYQIVGERVVVYGFTSVAYATDNQDVTLMFNDVGLGYRLWQGPGLLSSLTPAFEVHVTTPLDNRSANSAIQGIDIVALTGGIHIGLGRRSVLTLGVAAPITGPRPYEYEGIAQFNFKF